MNKRDENTFRVKPRAPRSDRGRDARFLDQVLTEVRYGRGVVGKPTRRTGRRGRATLHRGRVAAAFAGDGLNARSRRVIVKTRLVLLRTGSRAVATHLRYLGREGVGRDGLRGHAYDARSDTADLKAFEQRGREDRHQFRFIISPEDVVQIEDLRAFTRELMGRMEVDVGTRLEWVAVDHWDTDNPHTHLVLRGTDQTGRDLVIDRTYLTRGMRLRARELATEWLGPRTELEILRSEQRDVGQERWTGLDRQLQACAREGILDLREVPADAARLRHRNLLIARLQRLESMELARKLEPGRWEIREDMEDVLRRVAERGDIVRTMQRAFGNDPRELAIFDSRLGTIPVVGRIAAKGIADELTDKAYLVIDGLDGRGHYVALPPGADLTAFPVNGVAEVQAASHRVADRNIVALAVQGVYSTDVHRAELRTNPSRTTDPEEIVAGHVRRLEALRRAGIVERMEEGLWRVPNDLVERGRAYDRVRWGGTAVTLHSHLPVEQQIRAIGATWIDRCLVDGAPATSAARGFPATVQNAMRQREDFLIQQGLAQRQGDRVVLARNLLRTLRERDLEKAAEGIARDTGLTYRPTADGSSISGVYRRSLMLASGRFAMLEDGLGFSLVPWRPVVEKRLGQSIAAVVHGDSVSWHLGRSLGRSL
jgi:type IV secretory pathway VirD2 relaxase